MIFGLSFGKKKASTNEITDVNKTETGTGSQSQATTGFNQGTSSTSSTGSQSTTGIQTTTGTQNQSQTDRGTQSQTGTTTTLGSDVTAGLSTAVKALLAGGVNDANIANISNLISGTATGFDPESFVNDTVLAARTRGEQTLQESDAGLQSMIGGTAGTNSMAALLANRGRNDLEASLAGIRAGAVGQAEDIRNKNLATAVGAQGSLTDQAAGLGGILKGATTTVDMTTLTDQLSQLLGTQGQTTQNQSNTATAETQNTATTQLIAELVNALTNQSSTTIGTEKAQGTTKSGGGGFSIGI